MSDDEERRHCEAVALATLDQWAVRVHHDGVFNTVAMADIAALVARERAAARAPLVEALEKYGMREHDSMSGGCDAYCSPFPYPGQEPPGSCTCGADEINAAVRAALGKKEGPG